MKKFVFLIISVVLAVALFCGCSNTLSATTVEAENPKEFEITLDENVTTGYSWKCSIDNEDIVKLVSDKYNEPETDGKTVGVGGTHTWVFEGIKAGDAVITFDNMPPGRTEPENSIEYKYTITDDAAVLVDVIETGGSADGASDVN